MNGNRYNPKLKCDTANILGSLILLVILTQISQFPLKISFLRNCKGYSNKLNNIIIMAHYREVCKPFYSVSEKISYKCFYEL